MHILNISDSYQLIFLSFNELKDSRTTIIEIREKYPKALIYYQNELCDKKSIIRDKIKYLKGEVNIKINTRKCQIRVVDPIEKNIFLNKYHIQGADKSTITLGAYYYDELVSVMSFNNHRPMNGGNAVLSEYELTRFCTKNYIIAGIFSKLIKHFIEKFNPTKILSFADKRFTINKKENIYVANNFKFIKEIQADYYYTKLGDNNYKLYHKFNFGKRSIAKKFADKYNPTSTEREMMCENGYSRIWNLGKLKYELLISDNKPVFGFIYMIKNLINNKIYIGQTTRTILKRKYEYKKALLRETFYNQYLLNAFKKYGFENFEFSEVDVCFTLEELNHKEIHWIKHYNSQNKTIGYNIENGGRNSIPTEETLLKMSQSHKGIVQSNSWKEKRIAKAGSEDAKKYGRAKTEEEKAHLSAASAKPWLGKTRDEETKKKISETKKQQGLLPPNTKKVQKIDAVTGQVLAVYTSTTEAARQNPEWTQSTISRKCSGKTKNSGLVHWSFF